MASFRSVTVTNAGKELLLKATAETKSITFSSLKIGAGAYTDNEDLAALNNLKNYKNTYPITSVKMQDNMLKVVASIDNRVINVGYHITEIGIYAKKDKETEVLFAISTAIESDYITDKNSSPITVLIELYVRLSNTVNIEFNYTVPNGIYASVIDLENKVDKVIGKGLSTNDFTNEYKGKVDVAISKQEVTASIDKIKDKKIVLITDDNNWVSVNGDYKTTIAVNDISSADSPLISAYSPTLEEFKTLFSQTSSTVNSEVYPNFLRTLKKSNKKNFSKILAIESKDNAIEIIATERISGLVIALKGV